MFFRKPAAAVNPMPTLRRVGEHGRKNPIDQRPAVLLAVIAALIISTLAAVSVSAQRGDRLKGKATASVETWVEEWDPKRSCWVRLDDPSPECSPEIGRPEPEEIVYPLPRFGPFLMLNESVAVLVGTTSSDTVEQFKAMLREYPKITQINLVDASGTVDDVANLQIGRMIRASGISTHVPAHGSARSGAVELFLAGAQRTMDRGARFAVHRWRDPEGRGPQDFDEHDPVNMMYLDYYREMGMSHDKAHAFYNITNSVPYSESLWLGPEDMQIWLEP